MIIKLKNPKREGDKKNILCKIERLNNLPDWSWYNEQTQQFLDNINVLESLMYNHHDYELKQSQRNVMHSSRNKKTVFLTVKLPQNILFSRGAPPP